MSKIFRLFMEVCILVVMTSLSCDSQTLKPNQVLVGGKIVDLPVDFLPYKKRVLAGEKVDERFDFFQYRNQVLIDGKIVEIQNGTDISGRKDLNGIKIWLEGGDTGDQVTLKNVNFSCNYLARAELFDTIFIDCDFSETHLNNSILTVDEKCDFTNAEIIGASINLTPKQLQATSSYKRKYLRDVMLGLKGDCRELNFAGFDLRNSDIGGSLIDCDFTDASIEGLQIRAYSGTIANDSFRRRMLENARHRDIKIEQLLSTADFKKCVVTNVRVDRLSCPDHVVDFTNIVFVGCTFGVGDKPAKIDLTNSIISNCDFRDFKGLTLENVKSTWNYRHGRMEGILLPEEIQKALDAENNE